MIEISGSSLALLILGGILMAVSVIFHVLPFGKRIKKPPRMKDMPEPPEKRRGIDDEFNVIDDVTKKYITVIEEKIKRIDEFIKLKEDHSRSSRRERSILESEKQRLQGMLKIIKDSEGID